MDISCKPNIYLSRSTSEIRVRLVPSNMFKPSSNFLTDCSNAFNDPFVICVSCLSDILSCLLHVAFWSTDFLSLFYVMFSCVFDGVLDQAWYLIESITDLCLLPYFESTD